MFKGTFSSEMAVINVLTKKSVKRCGVESAKGPIPNIVKQKRIEDILKKMPVAVFDHKKNTWVIISSDTQRRKDK